MEFSPQQEEARDAVQAWLEGRAAGTDQRSSFYLGGFAGTGKTTLAHDLAMLLGGRTEFAAFTGKAALVLQQKGCHDARTIHSLIYKPVVKSSVGLLDLKEELADLEEGHPNRAAIEAQIKEEEERLRSPSFQLNPDSALKEADLLCLDEISQIDGPMGQDLESFGVPILALGDPFQLPPVASSQGYFTSNEPDFMLTEVHRQARDSWVLKLATEIRSGKALSLGSYGDCDILPKKGLTVEEAVTFDQIICGTNKTRKAINKRVRQALGFDYPLPVVGDRLICLRNDRESGVLNGSFWKVLDSREEEDGDTLRLALQDADRPDSGPIIVMAHRHHFEDRELPWFRAKDALEFDYGYAVTCHKAQGSQWDSVLIYDESWIARNHRRRWLYTAVTRAASRFSLVKM